MYKNSLNYGLKNTLEALGTDNKPKFAIEKPADEKHGDYATNLAMVLASRLKKSPLSIAKEISTKFPKLPFIERVEIEHPGFINFYLKKEALVKNLNKIIELANKYGSSDIGKEKKIVLEHTNVNPNKALHIGHLRSACLGSACEKILEFLGYNVEVEYYVDDTGVQVAVSALGISELGIEQKPDEKFDHYAGRAYVEAMRQLEKNKRLEKKKDEIINTLDKQESDRLVFLKELVNNVIRTNLETVWSFGIDYNVLIWESDIILGKFWEKALEILKGNPNFYLAKSGKNKGCWVMKDILNPRSLCQGAEQSLPETSQEKVIVKSNGVVTYTGKDIAYHFWKFNLLENGFKYKKWQAGAQKKPLYSTDRNGKTSEQFGHADSVVNFIDMRQTFPQEIIKRSLETLGYKKEAENFKHVAYGIVSLSPKTAKELGVEIKQGKDQYAMSGRAGIAVLADDLLTLAEKKLKQRHPDAPEPKKIAAAAIKYLMLAYNAYSDIVFSYDKALDFYGNSGPYLEYAYARCRSVLKKAGKRKPPKCSEDFDSLDLSKEEMSLLRWIVHFPETVLESGKQYAPNLLCNFLFELASRFNTFYNKRPILHSKKGPVSIQFRLLLTAATAQTLKNGLRLLGIERLEKM